MLAYISLHLALELPLRGVLLELVEPGGHVWLLHRTYRIDKFELDEGFQPYHPPTIISITN